MSEEKTKPNANWEEKVFLVSDKTKFGSFCHENGIVIDPLNLQAKFYKQDGTPNVYDDGTTPDAYFIDIFCEGVKMDSARCEPDGSLSLEPFGMGQFTGGYAPFIREYLGGVIERAIQKWMKRNDLHTRMKVLYASEGVRGDTIAALTYPLDRHNYKPENLIEV